MNGIKQLRQGEGGSVLMVVMGVLFITVTFLVMSILDVASDHRYIAQRQIGMEQAMYVAEGGMERGSRFLESNITTMVSSSTGATNGTGTINTGTYNYYITRTNQSTFSIICTGKVNLVHSAGTVARVVSLMRVYQPSYAQFAFWAATNGAFYFKPGDVFNGAVHTDDQLWFSSSGGGGAIFHSDCSSLATTYQGDDSGCTFDHGLVLGSYQGSMAQVDFNSASTTSLKSDAQTSGQVLLGSTTITFNGTSMKIWNDRQGWTNHTYTVPASGGIIYVQTATTGTSSTKPGTIYLNGGTLTGQMTLASEADMTVSGSITYTTDPRTHPTSTDALGLISMADIWVGTSAPDNLEIDAAMMATGLSGGSRNPGSFGVTNYDDSSYPHLGNRGTLTIYGGIVQQVRGGVCTFNNSTGATQTGYTKNYSYDPRFINTPPPFYPTVSGVLKYTSWTEGH